MKSKILVLALALVLVAASGFAAPRAETPAAAVADEGPQYGGTLNLFGPMQNQEPMTPNRYETASSQPMIWSQRFQEFPMMGDFEKYGPRGTGEYPFQMRSPPPMGFVRGALLESWEYHPYKYVWHVRPGIYWHGNKPQVMESRELVAEDMVFHLEYFRRGPAGRVFKGLTGDIYATDRYTLVIECPNGITHTAEYLVTLEDRATVAPPESYHKGISRWDHQVGTGAWMNTEYVVGSYWRFERNPDYWDTTTIDGVEYKLPFIDELMCPIIPDESTRIAALRAGKIDWFWVLPPAYWAEIARAVPAIQSYKGFAEGQVLVPNLKDPIIGNRDVRRALMRGINLQEMNMLLGVDLDLPIDWYPLAPGDPSIYIPRNELPRDIAILYDYDPTAAKKMLADAGYPNGFRMEVVIESTVLAEQRGALLVQQLAKIGVTVDLKVEEPATYHASRYNSTFRNGLIGFGEIANATLLFSRTFKTDSPLNASRYSNPRVDELVAMIDSEMDYAKRVPYIREVGLQTMRDVANIPLQNSIESVFWWPWVKNYFGENTVQDQNNPAPVWMRMWIDQELKKSMGY